MNESNTNHKTDAFTPRQVPHVVMRTFVMDISEQKHCYLSIKPCCYAVVITADYICCYSPLLSVDTRYCCYLSTQTLMFIV